MKDTCEPPGPPPPAAPAVLCCGLAAFASVRLSYPELAELRKRPLAIGPEPLPSTFLKHSDEQALAALAAVSAAVRTGPCPGPFTDWGVVAAPRHIGRYPLTSQLPRFLAEGAWGVSPHVIPHRSLHSVSGTLSQALKLRGPNFGAGGGTGCEAEGLLTAAALLDSMPLPGAWLVCSRLWPEVPADPCTMQPVSECHAEAVALALVPLGRAGKHLLELIPASASDMPSAALDLPSLAGMLDRLSRQQSAERQFGGWKLAMRSAERRSAVPAPHFSLPGATVTNLRAHRDLP